MAVNVFVIVNGGLGGEGKIPFCNSCRASAAEYTSPPRTPMPPPPPLEADDEDDLDLDTLTAAAG